jgi:phage-related protein
LVYLLVRLHTGKIPYDDANQSIEDLIKAKLKDNPKKLCQREFPQLTKFAEEIWRLAFSERPNYNYLKFLLQKNLLEQNTTSHGLIDFENSPVNHYQNQAELSNLSIEQTVFNDVEELEDINSHDEEPNIKFA